MVLVNRRELLSGFSDSPVVQTLAGHLLAGRHPHYDRSGLSERDRITIGAIQSVARNDRTLFEEAYSEIQRRQINDEVDWIFDNYLLFALVTAGLRFNADLSFAQRALEARRVAQSGPEAELTDDLLNLAKGLRVESPSPVVFVSEHLAGAPVRDGHALREVYAAATRLQAEWDDDFIRIVCVAASDIIVASSPLIPEVPSLFWRECNHRVTAVASGVHTVASVVVLSAWAAAVIHYVVGESQLLERLFAAGLLVFPAAIVWKRADIIRILRRSMLRLLGGHRITREAIRINAV
jgi:hypothetical protein